MNKREEKSNEEGEGGEKRSTHGCFDSEISFIFLRNESHCSMFSNFWFCFFFFSSLLLDRLVELTHRTSSTCMHSGGIARPVLVGRRSPSNVWKLMNGKKRSHKVPFINRTPNGPQISMCARRMCVCVCRKIKEIFSKFIIVRYTQPSSMCKCRTVQTVHFRLEFFVLHVIVLSLSSDSRNDWSKKWKRKKKLIYSCFIARARTQRT